LKKLLIILILLGVAFGLFLALRPQTAYANFPPAGGKTWVAFGDSLTSGYGASEGNDYPTVLGKALGISIINLGVPSQTTQDAVARVDEVMQLNPRVVLLCFGGNDTLQGVPAEQTFRNLATVIDELHRTGAFVVLIGIRSASVRDKYSSQFKRLAREKKVLLIPNILSSVLGDPRLMSDYVHPNDQGYAAVAARIEKILRPLLPELLPGQ
jgi:lysophospholipase L1-like esterase